MARWAAFLKESALKPHRIRYWLTPKPDPDFETKCTGVCSAYLEAPAAAAKGVRTVSIDEMTGIQALERAAPSLPMKPGKVERREFEYVRHGTQTLIAAFDVVSGEVQGSVGDSRTEADFVAYLEALFAKDAHASGWKIICDNLNTHVSEGVVRLVARLCGVNEELGEKGKSGHLKRRYSSHQLPLHSQTCLLAQSNRNLVFRSCPQTSAPRQFQIHRRTQRAHRGIYRLLQRVHGQALPLDLHRQAARRISPYNRGRNFRRAVLGPITITARKLTFASRSPELGRLKV